MNIMDIDGYKAAIAYDPDINLFRGEFIELNCGADFYGADVEPFRTFSGKSNVRTPPKLHTRLAQAAAAELFRPDWGCPDIDIQEPVDNPPQPTSIADEMDSMHEANRA